MTGVYSMTQWLAEPLPHFLVLGAVLFGLYALTRTPGSAPPSPTPITVTAGIIEQLHTTWSRWPAGGGAAPPLRAGLGGDRGPPRNPDAALDHLRYEGLWREDPGRRSDFHLGVRLDI